MLNELFASVWHFDREERSLTGTRMRRRSVCAFALVLSALLFVLTASPASGHAMLVESNPSEGQTLATTPAQFVLRFRKPVTGLLFRIVSLGDVIAKLHSSGAVSDTLAVAPPATLEAGTHLLIWRVVGADGHPGGGIVTFSVGAPGETPVLPSFRAGGLSEAIWVDRLLLYLSLIVGVGGVFFRAWIASSEPMPPIANRGIKLALASTFAAAAVGVCLQGLDALDTGWDGWANAAVWSDGLLGSFGQAIGLACLSAVVATAASLVNRKLGRVLAMLAIAITGAAIAGTGHGVSWGGPIASTIAWLILVVHVSFVVFWVGSLVPLAAMLRIDQGQRTRVLRRFSRTIPVPLAGLVLTGFGLALLQLNSVTDLWASGYGAVLLGKVFLVLILLALAAYNRFALTPRYDIRPKETGRAFARSITAEFVTVVAILGVLGLWRFAPPPAGSPPQERPIVALVHGSELNALLQISPAAQMTRSVSIDLINPDQRPFEADEVWVTATQISGISQPVRRLATHVGRGKWNLDGMAMPYAGVWTFKIDIERRDKPTLQLDQDVVL